MIYLREFILPKDTWVDCYFNYTLKHGNLYINTQIAFNKNIEAFFPKRLDVLPQTPKRFLKTLRRFVGDRRLDLV